MVVIDVYCDFFMFLDSMPMCAAQPVNQFSWMIAQNTRYTFLQLYVFLRFYGSFCRKTSNILFAKMQASTNANDRVSSRMLYNFEITLSHSSFQSIFIRNTPVNLELKEDSFWRKN
jgi:hypothetical protein